MITYRERKQIDIVEVMRLRTEAGFDVLSAETIRKQLDGSLWVLSAWDDERMVGFVRAVSDGVSVAYVTAMMVDRAYRRRGVGRELVRRLVENRSTVRFVLHSSDEGVAFYRALGFTDRSNMMQLDRATNE